MFFIIIDDNLNFLFLSNLFDVILCWSLAVGGVVVLLSAV